jgi:hypothetical protein
MINRNPGNASIPRVRGLTLGYIPGYIPPALGASGPGIGIEVACR